MKRYAWYVPLLVIMIAAALSHASAQDLIQATGAPSFVYNNYPYVPVQSTCDYIGAVMTWDPYENSARILYGDRRLTLVVGTDEAYSDDNLVTLAGPVIMVRDTLYCPAETFDRYLGASMTWEPDHHRAYFQGHRGRGYYDVDADAPTYALGIFASYGYAPVRYSTPFMLNGVTYLPLRNVADVIGAAVLIDLMSDRAVVTYDGVQTVMFIGSRQYYYGSRAISLDAAPIICGDEVYIPERLVSEQWQVPIRRDSGEYQLRGDRGWQGYRFADSPPAEVYRSVSSAPMLNRAVQSMRSEGITAPHDPGLVSKAPHGQAIPPHAGPRDQVTTGFPARAQHGPPSPASATPSVARVPIVHPTTPSNGRPPRVAAPVVAPTPRVIAPKVAPVPDRTPRAPAPRVVTPKVAPVPDRTPRAPAPRVVSPKVAPAPDRTPRTPAPRVVKPKDTPQPDKTAKDQTSKGNDQKKPKDKRGG